jgi:flagellar basal body rod protein FlgG
MNVGMYKGAAGMVAFEAWQETIAQNLASVAVPGYRKGQATFSSVVADITKIKHGDSVSQTEKGVLPTSKRSLNLTPGSHTYTGVDTNFSISGEGFFRIRMPDGTDAYTRNGNFRLADNYTLVTQEGNTVEGDGGPIIFRQQGGKVFVNSEGRILQDDQQVGRLLVFKFAKPEDVHRIGHGLLGPLGDNQATPIQNAPILHMTVEGSNVQMMEEMVNMIALGRAYDSAKKVLDVSDDTAGKAIQYLGAQS